MATTSPTKIQVQVHSSTPTPPTCSSNASHATSTASTYLTNGTNATGNTDTHRVQVSCRFRSQNDAEIDVGGCTCVRFSPDDPHTFYLSRGTNNFSTSSTFTGTVTTSINSSNNNGNGNGIGGLNGASTAANHCNSNANGTSNNSNNPTNDSRHSCFDYVFSGEVHQEQVYQKVAAPFVNDLLQGYNCSLLAYGQTGSGKTFTIFGDRKTASSNRGLLPRFLEELLGRVAANNNNNNSDKNDMETEVSASFIEVYQEKLRDLLYPQNTVLRIREDKDRGVWIDGVSEISVSSVDSAMNLIARGQSHRSIGSTQMNDNSSRSHGVFIVSLSRKNLKTLAKQKSKLFVVDLAGSEMVKKSCTSGKRLEEAKYINKSLSALGNVINALTSNVVNSNGNSTGNTSASTTSTSTSNNVVASTTGGAAAPAVAATTPTNTRCHIPYRDSKLTRLLQNSLGGNAKTHLILTCSSSDLHFEETQSTIRFGSRAKFIQNVAKINRLQKQTLSEHQMQLFHTLEDKIEALSKYIVQLEKDKQLCGKCRGLVDQEHPRLICDEGTTSTSTSSTLQPDGTSRSGGNSSRSSYCHGCLQSFNEDSNDHNDDQRTNNSARIVCDGNCGFVWHLHCARQSRVDWNESEEFLCAQCDQQRRTLEKRTGEEDQVQMQDQPTRQTLELEDEQDAHQEEEQEPVPFSPRWTSQVDFKDKLIQEEMLSLRKCLQQMEKERQQSDHESQLTCTLSANKEQQLMQVQQQLQEQLHTLQAEMDSERANNAQLACCMNQALRDKTLLEQQFDHLRKDLVDTRHKLDASDAQSEILRKTLDRQEKHNKRLQVALLELQKELDEVKKHPQHPRQEPLTRPQAPGRSETPSSSSLADEDDAQLRQHPGQLPRVDIISCNSPLNKHGASADNGAFAHEKPSPSAGIVGSKRFNVNVNLQNWWAGAGGDHEVDDQQHASLPGNNPNLARKAAAFCKTSPLPERAMTTAGFCSTSSSSNGSISPTTTAANRPFRTRLVGLLNSLEEETNSYRNLGERLALETRNCSRRTALHTSHNEMTDLGVIHSGVVGGGALGSIGAITGGGGGGGVSVSGGAKYLPGLTKE